MADVLVPKEQAAGETRVAATPESIKRLVKAGARVRVESGAGAGAFLDDAAYREAGAEVIADADEALRAADLVLVVGPLTPERAAALEPGAVVIGMLAPHGQLESVRRLVDGRVSALSLELLPRITRAQKMDALSSQASIAGYKAVLVAAVHLPKYFPLLMTAAGTVSPAKVVVMGAGVAGLQAVATARRLGAVVEVSDIRAEVEEQVQSLGGKFIPLPDMQADESTGGYAREVTPEFLERQRAIVAEHVKEADVVVTTALVPGKRAPELLSREMVESMRPGAVVVDLAVSQGGNCALSRPDEDVVHGGVRIVGPTNLAATMPADASALYARNASELALLLLSEDGAISIDRDDEIVAATLVTHEGAVVQPAVADLLGEAAGAAQG